MTAPADRPTRSSQSGLTCELVHTGTVLAMALRIALIGCGPLGRRYADLVTAHGSVVFVAFDADAAAAAGMIERTGARLAPSLRDAVTAVGVDAVVVCVDGDQRSAAIDAAADSGRAIFDAQPMSLDGMPALRRASDSGIVLGMDLRRRYATGISEVVDAVQRGQIGDVRSCGIVDRDEAMPVEESLVQDLDLARHITMSDMERVTGVRNAESTMLLLGHANGAITSIENSRLAPAGQDLRVDVAGTSGTVTAAFPSRAEASVATAAGHWRPRRDVDASGQSMLAQWAAFVDSVCRGVPTDIVTEADSALVAVSAALLALDEGRMVHVAELLSTP